MFPGYSSMEYIYKDFELQLPIEYLPPENNNHNILFHPQNNPKNTTTNSKKSTSNSSNTPLSPSTTFSNTYNYNILNKPPKLHDEHHQIVTEDFLLLAEGCELEGPIPRVVIPRNGNGNFNLDLFVICLLSVDSQTTKYEFTMHSDSQVFMSQTANKVYAFVEYFTLYDTIGRGFVRPFCLAYCSPDYNKLLSRYSIICGELMRTVHKFKCSNCLLFFTDMSHALSDLQFTREKLKEILQTNGSREEDGGDDEEEDNKNNNNNNTNNNNDDNKTNDNSIDCLTTRQQNIITTQPTANTITTATATTTTTTNAVTTTTTATTTNSIATTTSTTPVTINTTITTTTTNSLTNINTTSLSTNTAAATRNIVASTTSITSTALATTTTILTSATISDTPYTYTPITLNLTTNTIITTTTPITTTTTTSSTTQNTAATTTTTVTKTTTTATKTSTTATKKLKEVDKGISEVREILNALNKLLESNQSHISDLNQSACRMTSCDVVVKETPLDCVNFDLGRWLEGEGRKKMELEDFDPNWYKWNRRQYSYEPQLKTSLRVKTKSNLRSFNELCGVDGMGGLRALYKYLKRSELTLSMEGNDIQDIDPPQGLLTIGRTVFINFLANFTTQQASKQADTDSNQMQQSMTQSLFSPINNEASRWLSNETLISFHTCPSPLSTKSRDDDGGYDYSSSDGDDNITTIDTTIGNMKFSDCKPETEGLNTTTTTSTTTTSTSNTTTNTTNTTTTTNNTSNTTTNTTSTTIATPSTTTTTTTKSNDFTTATTTSTTTSTTLTQNSSITLNKKNDENNDNNSNNNESNDNKMNNNNDITDNMDNNFINTKRPQSLSFRNSNNNDDNNNITNNTNNNTTKNNNTNKNTTNNTTKASIVSIADHVGDLGNVKGIGYAIWQVFRLYPTIAVHFAFSLLIGRPLVIYTTTPTHELVIKKLVTALWVFVPGYYSVTRWTQTPLNTSHLKQLKLVGICRQDKKSFEHMIPTSLQEYITIFNFEKKTLQGPRYKGGMLSEAVGTMDNFHSDASYLAYLHTVLFELVNKSFIYFHAFSMTTQPSSPSSSSKRTSSSPPSHPPSSSPPSSSPSKKPSSSLPSSPPSSLPPPSHPPSSSSPPSLAAPSSPSSSSSSSWSLRQRRYNESECFLRERLSLSNNDAAIVKYLSQIVRTQINNDTSKSKTLVKLDTHRVTKGSF